LISGKIKTVFKIGLACFLREAVTTDTIPSLIVTTRKSAIVKGGVFDSIGISNSKQRTTTSDVSTGKTFHI
jgi:hypothetical protein